jgi:hypothetical protein
LKRIGVALTVVALFSILLISSGMPSVYAWNLFVTPGSRTVAPGDTTSFAISVTGTIPGNPNVQLVITPTAPSLVGITASFTANNVPAPFSSTMIVSVDPGKAPGDYVLPLVAHPAGVPIPGPGNIALDVHVIVGSGFDFSLALLPPSLTVKQGEVANFQIALSYSDPSYSGTTISIQVAGLGPGMNYQVIPSPPTLRITTSQSTPPGAYNIILSGSAMGRVHQTSAVLVVQPAEQPFDFSMSASPNQQTITPGGSTTYTITVNLVSGSSQNVALSVSGAPSGVSTSLNPTAGSPSFNSILSVSTTSSVAPGQYVMTITGTAGAKTESTTVTLTIGQAPDFRIEVNPASGTATQGQSTSYSVNVVGLNGFTSQVSLALSGLPAGVGGTFSVQSSVPDFSSTLTLTIPANPPTGSFTLTITGSGGGLTRVANVVLIITPAPTQTQTTTTQTETSPSSGGTDMLQQNSLLIIGALIIAVIVLAAVAMIRRGRPSAPQQQGPGRVFCGKCGTENPPSNEFCSSCGNKLKRN